MAQVLPIITGGQSLKELDRRFWAAQKKRLAHYNKGFYVDPERYSDLAARLRAVKARPGDLDARAALTVALLVAGKKQEAQRQAERVLAARKDDKLALFTSAQLHLARNDLAGTVATLKRLLAAGGDGYEVRLMLGRLMLDLGNLAAGKRHLDRAKKLDPERAQTYMLMVGAYEKAKDLPALIRELKALVQLDQQRAAYALRLVQLLAEKGDHAGVRRYGRLAYYIQPASARLYLALARAHDARAPRRNIKKARWHLQTALMIDKKLQGAAKLKKRLGVK